MTPEDKRKLEIVRWHHWLDNTASLFLHHSQIQRLKLLPPPIESPYISTMSYLIKSMGKI